MEVFEWFKTHVIDKKPDPSIDHRELVSVTDIILLVHVMFASEKKERKEKKSRMQLWKEMSSFIF